MLSTNEQDSVASDFVLITRISVVIRWQIYSNNRFVNILISIFQSRSTTVSTFQSNAEENDLESEHDQTDPHPKDDETDIVFDVEKKGHSGKEIKEPNNPRTAIADDESDRCL